MLTRVIKTTAFSTLVLFGCGGDPNVELETQNDELIPEIIHWIFLGPNQVRNLAGIGESYTPLGDIDDLRQTNSFFKDMGNTGRTCESCHGPDGGWTTSGADLLWLTSNGNDPLFLFTHDNGRCPDSDISTKNKRKQAMSLTIERGSTRGGGSIGPEAEFEAIQVDDPYNCSNTSLTSFNGYRKPNPISSMSQKSSALWAPAAPQPDMRGLAKILLVGATQFHGLTDYIATEEEQNQAADFMMNLYFAQIEDFLAGRLDDDGAEGGPVHLSQQDWFPGINHASTGPTTRRVFTIYDAWLNINPKKEKNFLKRLKLERRKQIAEGQEIFNLRENANGGTCSGCHNSPNVGSRSVYQLFDIGSVDINDPKLPRIHLQNKTTGEIRIVNNLGLAESTGLWADVGKMKVPILRGLSQRAPYFNSGQAKTLEDVVEHYDNRFNFNFTNKEKAALVAFLSAL